MTVVGTSLWPRLMGNVAALGLAATLAVPVHAQTAAKEQPAEADSGALEEIVITAQRREENLQDVPIAVAAVTAEVLENTGIDSSRDLPQIVPSVQFTRSGSSGLFFVRGVGTSNAAAGEEGANAVYVDGVYMGDLAQSINNFNNIERIEVLKGPQGTLFGRNATGGLIHIITKEPGDEAVLDGEFGFANYDTASSRLYLAAPITDAISADIAWTQLHQNDGWGRNLTLNRKNKIQDLWGVRSKIVARASDAVKFTLAGDYFENEDNLALGYKIAPGVIGQGGFTGPPGFDTTMDHYPLASQRIWGLSLAGEADLGFATLTSISAHRRSRNHTDFDVDGGPAPILNIEFVSGTKTYQQELRLASNESEPLAWQVGAFYLRSESANDSFFSGSAFGSLRGQHILASLKTDSYAVFGEASYAITPTTTLTAGLRYTKDKRHFDGRQSNVTGAGVELPPSVNPQTRLSYGAFTYRVALRQEITDDISVYGSVNRGFKAGSYNLQSPLNAPFLPQYIMAYEVGLKSQLFDRRLRLNLSAYHYDIDDYQVRSAAAAASAGGSVVLNAAMVKVDGIDAEFEAALTDQLRLFGGATYLNSRFSEFGGPGAAFQAPIVYPQPATCPPNLRGTRDPGILSPGPRTGGFATCFGDVSGNATALAPDFTASVGATYTAPIGASGKLRLTALYSYNSGYVFDPDERRRQGDFHLLNASIEYRPVENFGIELWAKNITGTEYYVHMVTNAQGTSAGLGAPRTYGVNVKFDF